MQDETIDINGMETYIVTSNGEPRGGLIVIHEVWGLTEHIKDVARRFAEEGYIVVAPNLLQGVFEGGRIDPAIRERAKDPATRDEAQKELRAAMAPMQAPGFAEETVKKLQQIYAWLIAQPEAKGTIGVIGYCFGGTYTFALAAAESGIAAAVPYYGHAPEQEEKLKNIYASVLAFYGQEDERLMNELPTLKEHMKEAGVEFEAVVYPGAGHAFFNDTNPITYRKDAAENAWHRTLAFLKEQMS